MNIEINETEARHLTRLINRELTQFKSRQNVDSEIRLRELLKKLNLTHDVKSDSEQLMHSCSVCGIHKHPVAGAKCKASNCLNEN
tara:strand:+ start:148 stop:402 length:255 start_codon:yes stop_codon:yes gene_type:complete